MKFRYIAGILLAAIMAAATVFVAAGCDEDETVAATGVTVSKTELSLTVGESATLTATVTPDNATDKSVTWTSSDPAVATVEGGEVTAVAEGGATITAACGEVSASVSCTVSAAQEPDRTTVTEAEWEAAFAEEKFENFKMTVDVFAMQDGEYIPVYTMEYVAADGKRYIAANGIGESAAFCEETFEVYSETEIVKYSKQTDGIWGTTEQQYSGDRHNGIKGIPLSGWRALRGKYKDFMQPSADEEAYSGMVYVVGEGVDSGAAPTWNEYKVAFKNGVLSTVECMPAADSNSMEALKIAFTFGGQSIQLPEISDRTTVTEAEWEAAFAEEKFENFKMTATALSGSSAPMAEYIAADGGAHLLQGEMEYYWRQMLGDNYLVCQNGIWNPKPFLARELPISPIPSASWEYCRTIAFDSQSYDAVRGCYLVEAADYGFVNEIYFENGNLHSIIMTQSSISIRLDFTFGGQSLELPAITLDWALTDEEWEAAFVLDEIDNWGLYLYEEIDGQEELYITYASADGKECVSHSEEIEGPTSSFIYPRYSVKEDAGYTIYTRQTDGTWKTESSEQSLYEAEEWSKVMTMLRSADFTFDNETLSYRGTVAGMPFSVILTDGCVREIHMEIGGFANRFMFVYGDQIVELPPEIGAIS